MPELLVVIQFFRLRHNIKHTSTQYEYIALKENYAGPYHILDPLIGLSLRVDKEGPSPGELDYHSVLHRQSVLWQAGNLPPADVDRVGEGGYEGGRGVVRDTVFGEFFLPLVDQSCSIFTLGHTERREICTYIHKLLSNY